MSVEAEDHIVAHVRACGMDIKKYKKIERVVSKILDPKKGSPSVDRLLTVFAQKCYANFPEEDGKKQAEKFLKVLYKDLEVLVEEGPAHAIEWASQDSKGKEKVMRIVRLNQPIDGFTKKLDCYLVGETLGKGATSVVKRGRREGQDKAEVAIKILTLDDASFKLEELKKEIEVLKALDHKNVIKMYDCFEHVQYPGYSKKPTVVMILELATKGELFDFFMHTGKFEPPLARWFFKQLIDGLEYCHSKKIAHRDLKPENLLMGEGFNVKLVDFGFARFWTNKRGKEVKMKTALGTPGYAAPEILKREKYDFSVDIFSLGVILFICIAGFPPFQEAKASDWWFDKLMKKKFVLFWKAHERCMKFDDDAKDILQGMLAAKPSDRYSWVKLRNHKWTKGKTYSQTEACKIMMSLKAEVDKELIAAAANTGANARRAFEDYDPPLLGTFLPVHHILTTFAGTQALETVQDYITNTMFGSAEKVKTSLWVGPFPEAGMSDQDEHVSEQTGEGVPKENKAVGFFWNDLEFTVRKEEEKKTDKFDGDDLDFVDMPSSGVDIRGVVCVRRHPTMKSEDGVPLNVVYFKRGARALPHDWYTTVNHILSGVSHMMYGTTTKYFKGLDDVKESVAMSSAVTDTTSALSSVLCCSTDAAKKLVN